MLPNKFLIPTVKIREGSFLGTLFFKPFSPWSWTFVFKVRSSTSSGGCVLKEAMRKKSATWFAAVGLELLACYHSSPGGGCCLIKSLIREQSDKSAWKVECNARLFKPLFLPVSPHYLQDKRPRKFFLISTIASNPIRLGKMDRALV